MGGFAGTIAGVIADAGHPTTPGVSPQTLAEASTAFPLAQAKLQQAQQTIQGNDIALETARRQQQAEKALDQALSESVTTGANGQPTVDWNAATNKLARMGWGAEALKASQASLAAMQNAIKLRTDQIEQSQKTLNLMGSLAASVPTVDWTEKDPAKLAGQVSAAQGAAMNAISKGLQIGVLDPNTAGMLAGQLKNGYSPQVEQEIQQFANMAKTAEQQHADHLSDMRAAAEKLTGQKTQQDIIKQQTEHASQVLGAAQNQQDWENGIATLRQQGVPETVLGTFGTTYTPEAAQRATNIGMTPGQRALAPGREATAASNQMKVAAQKFAANPATDQDSYDAFLATQPPEVRAALPKVWSEDVPDMIAAGGMTASQKSAADARQARIDKIGSSEGALALASVDPNEDPETRQMAAAALAKLQAVHNAPADRARQAEIDKQRKQHATYQANEHEQWRLIAQYDAVLTANPSAQNVQDPDHPGQQIPRDQLVAREQEARNKAQVYQDAARDIRAQLGGPLYNNEVKPGQTTPTTPAAKPAPATPAPKPNVQPAQKLGKLRSDVPPSVSAAIPEGQTRLVTTPNGQFRMKKVNGKIYEVAGGQ